MLLLHFAITSLAQDEDFADVGVLKSATSAKWGGTKWLKREVDGFHGRPATEQDQDTNRFITIAYSRFVTCYDLSNQAPRWVAYVTDRSSASVSDAKSRSGKDFARPSGFFTDGVLAEAAARFGVEPTEHYDFSDKVPSFLADAIPRTLTAKQARTRPTIIERGHLAPNNAMKCWGSATGKLSRRLEQIQLAKPEETPKKPE